MILIISILSGTELVGSFFDFFQRGFDRRLVLPSYEESKGRSYSLNSSVCEIWMFLMLENNVFLLDLCLTLNLIYNEAFQFIVSFYLNMIKPLE